MKLYGCRLFYWLVMTLISVNYTVAFAQSSHQQPEHPSQYNQGYQMGHFLSGLIDKQGTDEFLKGIKAGLANSENIDAINSQIKRTRADWLNDTSVAQKSKAAYAAGFLASKSPAISQERFDVLSYMLGLFETSNHPDLDVLNLKSAQQLVRNYDRKVIREAKYERYQLNKENIKRGEAFLQANKDLPGIEVLDNGLQYKMIQQGQGAIPDKKDIVELNVVGKKIDGEVFYDTKQTLNQPIKMPLTSAIHAWQIALKQMKPGAMVEIYTPSELAYGIHGWKNVVEPGEALIYQLELLNVESK